MDLERFRGQRGPGPDPRGPMGIIGISKKIETCAELAYHFAKLAESFWEECTYQSGTFSHSACESNKRTVIANIEYILQMIK